MFILALSERSSFQINKVRFHLAKNVTPDAWLICNINFFFFFFRHLITDFCLQRWRCQWLLLCLIKNIIVQWIVVSIMDYDYMPFHREKDFHNRCCGGKLWCIKAKSYEYMISDVPLRMILINLITN